MSWSYSGDPSDSTLDEVRFWVQDTDSADQLMSDEEIQFLLDSWDHVASSALYTAAVAAEVIAARFAREVNVSADGVSVSVSELQQKYNDLAASLRDQYKEKGATGSPFAGGSHWSEMNDAGTIDPAIRPLWAWLRMHDNINAGPQDLTYYGSSHWWLDSPEDSIQP